MVDQTAIALPPEYESNALVLHPGDVVVVRNREKLLTAVEAQQVQEIFSRYDIKAIVVGADWEIVRDTEQALATNTKGTNA